MQRVLLRKQPNQATCRIFSIGPNANLTKVRYSQKQQHKAGLRLSTWQKLANWPITDAPDDTVVSLHDAPDAVVSDSKNESDTTPVDSLSAPTTRSW